MQLACSLGQFLSKFCYVEIVSLIFFLENRDLLNLITLGTSAFD